MFGMGSEQESRSHKHGPASLAELACWPATVLKSLLCAGDGSDGERIARLQALLRPGVCMYSDYSGLAGEYELMCQMRAALTVFAAEHDTPQLKDVGIDHSRFCDHGKVQQKVLSSISEMHDKQICVLSDINDRLPAQAQQILDGMLPPDEKISAEAAAAAYASMFEWLRTNRSLVFPSQPTCHCIVHERMCPVFPQGSDAGQGPARSPPLKRVRRKLFQSQSESSEPCCMPPSQQKLRVNVAGTTCIGWSQAGKGLHFADPSERPHAIWATERLRRAELGLEDMFFAECTPRYPVKVGWGEVVMGLM